MEKIKYGVIGTGHMGLYHINVVSTLPEVELVGIYDSDKKKSEQLAPKYLTQAFLSPQELIKKCEAVSIAVPTTMHYEIGKKVLESGCHTLIEKPITHSIKEAEDLISLAQKKKKILQVGHVERFNSAVQELNRIVDRPYLWESRRLGPNTGRIKDVGVVLDLMIHDIDICLRVVQDEVSELHAFCHKESATHEDVATASLRFKQGCVANLVASRATQEKIRTLAISQKDSYITLDFTTQDLQIHRQASTLISTSIEKIKDQRVSLIERLLIHNENPLKTEINYFLTCIKNQNDSFQSNKIDLETLRIALEIAEKIKNP